MSNDNLTIWNEVEKVPEQYLKQIGGGPLKGMTDINPQWRLKKLTEVYGECGIGWWYEIMNHWTFQATEKSTFGEITGTQIALFVEIRLHIADRIGFATGVGGSMLQIVDRNGVHLNDEAMKMATTDAISVACKGLGIGSAVYEGRWDGSKYKDEPQGKPEAPATPPTSRTRTAKAEKQEEKPASKTKVTPKVDPTAMPTGNESEYLSTDAQENIIRAFDLIGISQETLEDKYGKPMSEWTNDTKKLALSYYKTMKNAQKG